MTDDGTRVDGGGRPRGESNEPTRRTKHEETQKQFYITTTEGETNEGGGAYVGVNIQVV